MGKELSKKRKKFIFSVFALLLIAAIYFFATAKLSSMLTSQSAAQRWQGDSERKYAQISCFVPVDQTVSLSDIYAFRQVIQARLQEAGMNINGEETLCNDAWSTSGKVTVSSAIGMGEVTAYAVGGDFFSFHPLRLLSGSYLTAKDLMKDRVLLDEETAWLLFGGTDIAGQGFKIGDKYYVVAGVFERDGDNATAKAFSDGMCIFMSYEGYCDLLELSPLDGSVGINCYELVMPEPVKGFAEGAALDKFPIGRGEVLNNTYRYSPSRLLKLARQFGVRSMQNKGIIYPYWENAARYTEDISALITSLCLILSLIPIIFILVLFTRSYVFFRKRILPEKVERIREKR